MVKNKKISLVMFTFLAVLTVVIHLTDGYNFEEIIASVNETERLNFVRYHVRLGRELIRNKKISKIDLIPEEFSVVLYNYVMANHLITDDALVAKQREIVCFDDCPDDSDECCIDIGDIGVHP